MQSGARGMSFFLRYAVLILRNVDSRSRQRVSWYRYIGIFMIRLGISQEFQLRNYTKYCEKFCSEIIPSYSEIFHLHPPIHQSFATALFVALHSRNLPNFWTQFCLCTCGIRANFCLKIVVYVVQTTCLESRKFPYIEQLDLLRNFVSSGIP